MRFRGHTAGVVSAAFSPDGTRIATGSFDSTARLWDLSGKPLAVLAGHTGGVSSVGFSPDGQCILTASFDGTARLWDLNGNQLVSLNGHASEITSAVFSCDGKQILTASADQIARLWDATGRLLATLRGHAGIVTSAAVCRKWPRTTRRACGCSTRRRMQRGCGAPGQMVDARRLNSLRPRSVCIQER